MRIFFRNLVSKTQKIIGVGSIAVASIGFTTLAFAQDPMASNNGLYPEAADYSGHFTTANLDYPKDSVDSVWFWTAELGPINVNTAPKYADAFKKHLEPSISGLVNDAKTWNNRDNGWFDMVWSGEGSPGEGGTTDPTSGREAIMNTYSGQILPADTFSPPFMPTVKVQNHAAIYYNRRAAVMLGDVFENIYAPDLDRVDFPEGSIVVKVEAATPTPKEWSVLKDAAIWNVFRPTTADQFKGGPNLKAQVIEARPFQMSIKVKDRLASPETGWVYMGFVYDANSEGKTPWDRFVPMGVQWGNDPEFARDPNGLPEGESLKETWVNKNAPAFIRDTLGWGGRLAGPMDVATRHNVLTPSGKRYQGADHLRASSCMSCHGSAEFPFTANLYPSPNKSFPVDGQQFLLYDPGSEEWARWFQNRDGSEPMSSNIGGKGLDYDMVLMFAISSFNAAMGNDAFVREHIDVH